MTVRPMMAAHNFRFYHRVQPQEVFPAPTTQTHLFFCAKMPSIILNRNCFDYKTKAARHRKETRRKDFSNSKVINVGREGLANGQDRIRRRRGDRNFRIETV